MTIDEIVEKLKGKGLQDVADRVPHVATRYKSASLNDVIRLHSHDLISQPDWEAYCYLWRNASYRFSSAMECYTLD